MDVAGKTVAVTGAAHGIGRALAQACHARGARAVACLDLDGVENQQIAREINGLAVRVDVSDQSDLVRAIDAVEAACGPIDLFCSNAGVLLHGGLETSDADWQRAWSINVMAHLWAARRLIPGMVARGGGCLLNTASAAGLLNQIGAVSYGVTKHAAVGLAEWLALSHAHEGIAVSVLCPQGVATDMIAGHETHVAAADGLLSPQAVAEAALDGVAAGQFLILPHPQVRKYMQNKAADTDRWIAAMAALNDRYVSGA